MSIYNPHAKQHCYLQAVCPFASERAGGGGQEGEPAGVREEERIALISLFYGGFFFNFIVCTKTRGKEKN